MNSDSKLNIPRKIPSHMTITGCNSSSQKCWASLFLNMCVLMYCKNLSNMLPEYLKVLFSSNGMRTSETFTKYKEHETEHET